MIPTLRFRLWGLWDRGCWQSSRWTRGCWVQPGIPHRNRWVFSLFIREVKRSGIPFRGRPTVGLCLMLLSRLKEWGLEESHLPRLKLPNTVISTLRLFIVGFENCSAYYRFVLKKVSQWDFYLIK